MAHSTRGEIMQAFLDLLEERPSGKVTVKDIVERCGVNRNTFYYYFQDLPTLTESLVQENAQQIIDATLTPHSVEECLNALISGTLEHRRALLHLYRSSNREHFELSQWRVCTHLACRFFDTIVNTRNITPGDQSLLIQYLSALLFGLSMSWLEQGMTVSIQEEVHRLCFLLRGQIDEVLDRCEEDR